MDEQMFCFQCEQAAGCTACTGAAGVCGKSAETAAAQDRLTGALIAFAGQLIAAGRGPAPEQARLLMQGLFTTITNVNFDPAAVDALTRQVHDASPGTGPDYDMQALWREPDADRVFTTSVVAYPGVPHIDEGRDFSPVIEKALELGGYAQDTLLPGLNGGSTVTTGFARTAVLQHADEIVQAVRDGKLRHFFLVGGCDGTRPSRRYYTEFARLTPPDTILLTLACGKFRLNDLPLGTVPGTGLPRILDVGQCNDAYSAIRIALALADAFGCGVNDLPLSLVLCWFEQKAVCILIALLALGIRNIRLGPTLPPFLSPGVVRTLQERYGLKPIATPEADLQAILGG